MKKNPPVIVIGAGIGGLGAAIRLQLSGHQVTVFEARPTYGGKLSEFYLNGYRFDGGPSLFTLPDQVDQLFRLAGKEPQKYFTYSRLPIICRYFYPDGLVLNAYREVEKFCEEIGEKTKDKAGSVKEWLEKSSTIYQITSHVFLERSLHKLSTYLRKDTLISLLNIRQIDSTRTMHRANAGQFVDPRVVQLFDRYATYNGSDPYQAPATLNVIPHLEFSKGAYLPDGGMVAIPRSLYTLAKEIGVEFHFNSPVEKIQVENGHAIGVEVGGKDMPAQIVVSNMDVVPTYRKLLPDVKAPEKKLSQPRSSSAVIFYWGINRTFPELDLHNIFFAKNYQKEFEVLWKEKTFAQDVTIYVFISSKHLAEDAPPGCENWFVMVNAPANIGQDWDTLIPQVRETILITLNNMLQTKLEDHIECEEILDPRTIESKTSSYQGALYGSSSNNKFAAFLRHPNFTRKIKNLYFCGGSVHPGGGIPLSLLSAKIVADLVSLQSRGDAKENAKQSHTKN